MRAAVHIYVCMGVGECGKRARDGEIARVYKSLFSEEGHTGLSKHTFASVWHQSLQMFADILNAGRHRICSRLVIQIVL